MHSEIASLCGLDLCPAASCPCSKAVVLDYRVASSKSAVSLAGRRKEENAVWDEVEAKDACLRRLNQRGFPREMRDVAEAGERFYELGVYYRNPLEVSAMAMVDVW